MRRIDYFSEYGFDFFIVSIILFIICSIFSIIIYSFYSRVFKREKDSESDIKIKVNRICGHIIYSEENIQGKTRNQENIDLKESNIINDDNKKGHKDQYIKNQKNICCYSCKLGAKNVFII